MQQNEWIPSETKFGFRKLAAVHEASDIGIHFYAWAISQNPKGYARNASLGLKIC